MKLPDDDDRRAALRDFQNNLVVIAGAGHPQPIVAIHGLAHGRDRARRRADMADAHLIETRLGAIGG